MGETGITSQEKRNRWGTWVGLFIPLELFSMKNARKVLPA